MKHLQILATPPATDVAAALLGAADGEYLARYPNLPPEAATTDCNPLEAFIAPNGCFLVAFSDGVAAGCVGLMRNGDGCEVKRMFVVDRFRRQGIARQLLDAIERKAIALGYPSILIESGVGNPEAIRLYEANGYARFEHVRGDENSIWFVKAVA